jgi:hypothetical protein
MLLIPHHAILNRDTKWTVIKSKAGEFKISQVKLS